LNRKLLFLDVDGTLTPPGSNTPPVSALRAIEKARENGHMVFLCSGRNRAMLMPLLSLGCFDGAVASAGGFVFCGDRVLFDCPMPDSQRDTALRLFEEQGVLRTVEACDASYCDTELAEFLGEVSGGSSELVRWRRALEKDLDIRPMSEYDGRPVYKIGFTCRRAEQLSPAVRALERDYHFLIQDVAAADCVNGELINRRFDKGRGILRICEALAWDASDTAGFGDSMNDLEMIETVGVGVSMANGSPELRRHSDLICPPVEADGLAQAFERLGLI